MKMDFLKEIIGEQLRQMQGNSRKLGGRYDEEAVHDLRVAALKMDFALKLFKPSRDNQKIQIIRNQLKEARRVMGEARNLDVLVARTKKNLKEARLTPSHINSIKPLIESRQSTSHQVLRSLLTSPPYRGVLKDLKALPKCHPMPGISSVIHGPFKQTLQALLKYCGKKIRPPDLHKIRIALKKIHYGCQFLEDLEKP